jgi:hypothetical protein
MSKHDLSDDSEEREAYEELSFYTLSHGDPTFIHQHIVDTFAAQHARPDSKPISVAFALIGLYLYIEKGFTGREVQKAHMRLAKKRRMSPTFPIPESQVDMTVHDVLQASAGLDRDAAIHRWAAAVWLAWSDSHTAISNLAQEE